jgi:hypothetical protein
MQNLETDRGLHYSIRNRSTTVSEIDPL